MAIFATLGLSSPTRAQSNVPVPAAAAAEKKPVIVFLEPPQERFFAKQLDFHGIPILAARIVSDRALYAAYDRLALQLKHLPVVTRNLAAKGAQLQIIGKDQVTSDLPDHRPLKGKPLPQYNGLTVDERTRGLGGLHVSCGEENLLKLEQDRYRGRDICLHEFAHNIFRNGIQKELRERFDRQYHTSLDKGLWVGAYAASNLDEYFAELTMWYFGTRGDLNMTGAKPAEGPGGLKAYDPDAFALFDDCYGGRIPVEPLPPATNTKRQQNK